MNPWRNGGYNAPMDPRYIQGNFAWNNMMSSPPNWNAMNPGNPGVAGNLPMMPSQGFPNGNCMFPSNPGFNTSIRQKHKR